MAGDIKDVKTGLNMYEELTVSHGGRTFFLLILVSKINNSTFGAVIIFIISHSDSLNILY